MRSVDPDDSLIRLDAALRREADELLDGRGLRRLLEEYGRLHVTGSYALRLMTWRDLDLYLEVPELSVERFFELGGRIAALLAPMRMTFHHDREGQSELEGHEALYWGIKPDVTGETWKIDLHAVRSHVLRALLARNERITARLTPEKRLTILRIKSALWRHAEYRKGFASQDIYDAVLDADVTDLDAFGKYLSRTKGISL